MKVKVIEEGHDETTTSFLFIPRRVGHAHPPVLPPRVPRHQLTNARLAIGDGGAHVGRVLGEGRGVAADLLLLYMCAGISTRVGGTEGRKDRSSCMWSRPTH